MKIAKESAANVAYKCVNLEIYAERVHSWRSYLQKIFKISIMTKFRNIRRATAVKRFDRLSKVAFYANECIQALACQLGTKEMLYGWTAAANAFQKELARIKVQYYPQVDSESLLCETIERIPQIRNNMMPNIFLMSEKLYQVGYYKTEGFHLTRPVANTETDIINNVYELQKYAAGCLKSISYISYPTIWKGLGDIVNQLNENYRDVCTKTAQINRSFATDNSLKTQLQ